MIKVKIGRAEYEITKADRFMDNGACVQLLTQNKNSCDNWGRAASPVLSKKLVAELDNFGRVQVAHKYGHGVHIYRLAI